MVLVLCFDKIAVFLEGVEGKMRDGGTKMIETLVRVFDTGKL